MPDISDFVDLSPTLHLQGRDLTLRGLSLKMIGKALGESPELRKLVQAKGPNLDVMMMLTVAPNTIAYLLAGCITSQTGDDEIDDIVGWVEDLPLGDELTLCEKIVEISFPGGVSPFLDRLGLLFGQRNLSAKLAAFGKDQATALPPPRMN